ncbi:DUF3304 domain-containing protein [Pseudogulbenkiania subflava]|uniref:DUF3304 domain-containing protein n=1 Tax=Pseudogulbenkiania subflava DSM 22618 TaxID=1123014 RepID=A0A1Y6BIX6_9NEIS|nr:DUF3304 domain-containing protein [Pseudogulbenkiania subflava]SMF12718.1 Protein of unknown function [Pseudogulbenkiania subflava DSM 22618]
MRNMLPVLLFAALLSACGSLGANAGGSLSAPLTAVNYTDWPFDWVGVATVAEPEKAMAADRATAFGASGQMCCVSLPEKWQPGMELVVQTQDGTHAKSAKEWGQEHIPIINHRVVVPRYDSSDVGTVWVQLLPGGNVELVVSRFDPTHAQWPGKVKGWPVPTVEYRRNIWDRDMKEKESSVRLYAELLSEIDTLDLGKMKENWDSDQKYSKDNIKGFKGYDDPAYRAYKKAYCKENLVFWQQEVKLYERLKP